jgi:hypothetical protein
MLTVGVNSTDVDVSPTNWSLLTASLTTNIFQTVTLFDEPFASLKSLRCALRGHVVFTEFREL